MPESLPLFVLVLEYSKIIELVVTNIFEWIVQQNVRTFLKYNNNFM